jgi:uncharacterized protein (TIGR03545 family)
MDKSNQPKAQAPQRKQKPVGPIRWNAIIPFTFFSLLIGLYFHFLFDLNLKKGLEWMGTKVVGAEVNIRDFKTSFFNASLRIQGVELTDAETPTHNSLSIGDIRFALLWDALLRVKFVVNEAVVEQIEFGKKRAYPGRVLPPPPPEPEDKGPSKIEQETEKLKSAALEKTQEKYSDNVIGDIAGLLGGAKADDSLDKFKEGLLSKKMADKLEQELTNKQKVWNEKFKTLPQAKEFQALIDRLGKVKTSNFKSPQELSDSLKEIDTIFKEGDAKYKLIQAAKTDLDTDVKFTQDSYRQFESQVKDDIKSIEKHFKIPQIDAKSLTFSLFKKYFDPYLAKINHYQALAKKYLPPNLMKKDKPNETDISMQPHPREKGVTYEFGKLNSYPLFWVKKIAVSSQAGATPESGNIRGEILDLTSQQALVGRPTIATFNGDFPGAGISSLQTKLSFDNRKNPSDTDLLFKIGSYAVEGRPLVQSDDVNILMLKAKGGLDVSANLKGLRNITLSLNNRFSDVSYDIKAKDSNVQDILKGVFNGLPAIDIKAQGAGLLPKVPFDITSNVGAELQKGFEKQIQAKIDEARKKIQALIDSQLSEQKKKIEAQVSQFKGQFEKELKKIQEQAEAQKKSVTGKAEQAKKDAETQAKKKVEGEGQKAIDDLKKKFGF